MNHSAAKWPARAEARVDLDAIAANCSRLRAALTSGAELCAVVKADGYGHGMLPAARAALAGGATRLAVVTVEEAEALAAKHPGVPLLLMAPVAPQDLSRAIATGAELMVWDAGQVAEAAAAATARIGARVRLHIKRDTGMGRFGARSDEQALAALAAAEAAAGVEPYAVWTHFATADEDDAGYFEQQLAAFERFVDRARAAHPALIAHAANSAAALREPRSHFNFVRCGIAIYGLDPFHEDAVARKLTPALSLRSRVAAVRDFGPGETVGYGRRFTTERATRIATVTIGYGDGWRRILGNRSSALISGRRYPQVGTVSMDSIMVDVGPGALLEPGEEVTLLGRDGGEMITTEQVARQAQTINYEITCGLTPRTQRTYVGEAAPREAAGGA